MHTAFPVNDQHDFAGVGIDIDDDFVNECTNQAFLHADIRRRPMPDGLQIRGEMLKFFAGGHHGPLSALSVLIDALLDLADTLYGLIPAAF